MLIVWKSVSTERREAARLRHAIASDHVGALAEALSALESQHFTAPRRLSLSLYPPDLALGFDRGRWMELCEQLNRRDNAPPYRDEQRAWLDVLRDFSAVLLGNRPTVRIYAGDARWCSLDPAREEDAKGFAERYLPDLDSGLP